jgi:hypothetical protein
MKYDLVYGNYIKADLQLSEKEFINGCVLCSAQKIGESVQGWMWPGASVRDPAADCVRIITAERLKHATRTYHPT